GSVSHKMLTKTLRQLERDGLVTRRVHAAVPPRVDYSLTPLGESLGESVCGICTWVGKHMAKVQRASRAYDGKRHPPNSQCVASSRHGFGQNLCPLIPGLGRRPRARNP